MLDQPTHDFQIAPLDCQDHGRIPVDSLDVHIGPVLQKLLHSISIIPSGYFKQGSAPACGSNTLGHHQPNKALATRCWGQHQDNLVHGVDHIMWRAQEECLLCFLVRVPLPPRSPAGITGGCTMAPKVDRQVSFTWGYMMVSKQHALGLAWPCICRLRVVEGASGSTHKAQCPRETSLLIKGSVVPPRVSGSCRSGFPTWPPSPPPGPRSAGLPPAVCVALFVPLVPAPRLFLPGSR